MMMDQRRADEATKKMRNRERAPFPMKCCPACESTGTLKMTSGMILCTHCFWAIEVKQAS